MKQEEIENSIREQREIIMSRESSLRETDYIGIKIAEGAATKTEYASIRSQRQQWRDDINSAAEEIARLEAMEPEQEEISIEEE